LHKIKNMGRVITLSEFIVDRQKDFPFATGELSSLLGSIRLASKIVNREVNKAGLTDDILGATDNQNIQGETQQKLDVYANDEFIRALVNQGEVCGIGSEEDDNYLGSEVGLNKNGKYILLMDPLDGSSNIDVNVSIGTIFSIYKRVSPVGGEVTIEDFLQPGNKQVAAGYVIYGSSTMLVFTTGNGVNGFTLDPSIGVFCLSHPNMMFKPDGTIYSINEGNFNLLAPGVQDYIRYCQSAEGKNPYSARYIGSLVADFHRNMIKGGIYIYPATSSAPNGKLRLLYEANPLAFIAEQAGGLCTDGVTRIMDIEPTELHQRCPLYVGSRNMVQKAHQFLAKQTV